jgi:hypothetical protein
MMITNGARHMVIFLEVNFKHTHRNKFYVLGLSISEHDLIVLTSANGVSQDVFWNCFNASACNIFAMFRVNVRWKAKYNKMYFSTREYGWRCEHIKVDHIRPDQ